MSTQLSRAFLWYWLFLNFLVNEILLLFFLFQARALITSLDDTHCGPVFILVFVFFLSFCLSFFIYLFNYLFITSLSPRCYTLVASLSSSSWLLCPPVFLKNLTWISRTVCCRLSVTSDLFNCAVLFGLFKSILQQSINARRYFGTLQA